MISDERMKSWKISLTGDVFILKRNTTIVEIESNVSSILYQIGREKVTISTESLKPSFSLLNMRLNYTLLTLKYKVNLLKVPFSSVVCQNVHVILTATGSV